MALRVAIAAVLGAEREKISQYVLEKLVLFFFSVSDPVSLRTKTRTRQNRRRSSILAARRAPVPTPHRVAAAPASSPGLHTARRALGNI